MSQTYRLRSLASPMLNVAHALANCTVQALKQPSGYVAVLPATSTVQFYVCPVLLNYDFILT